MSDSDSDSDTSVSSRAASPGPANVVPELHVQAQTDGPVTEISSAAQDTPNPDEAEAEAEETDTARQQQLGPDARLLHIEHDVTPKVEEGEEQPSIGVDIVVIHGVYGDWKDEENAGPGSGSSTWVQQYRESLKCPYRVMRFEYDPLKVFAGRRSREAIRICALTLLRALVAVRQYDSSRRLLMFVAHDIGGIIVKDALVAAALKRNFLDIFEMSRILVFLCCPHRSLDHLDMEERLCRFLYASYDQSGVANVRPSISSIAGFAAAVTEINGLFVESKITLRSKILSVSGQLHRDINAVFDEFYATMGIPFEKRYIQSSESVDYTDLTSYLGRLEYNLFVAVDELQLRHEREMLALSSPVLPLQSPKLHNMIEDLPLYKSWLNNPGPQILYLYGTDRVRDVAEQVFYSLEDLAEQSERRTVVLYFNFDKWDVRCDSWRDMLSTFLAQIMCHYPRLTHSIKVMFARLHQEKGWTEADLVHWFERFRFTDEIEHVMFVVNQLDESIKRSQRLFLQNFAYLSRACEAPWKIVVTSHMPGALSDQLLSPWAVHIDLLTLDQNTSNINYFERNMTRLIKLRPDLSLFGDRPREELLLFEGFDDLERSILWEQARVNPNWPDNMTIQEIFGPLDVLPGRGGDHNLQQLLQWVLSRLPEQATVGRILSWLLYSVRPLSIWELATVIYMGSEHDKKGDIFPSEYALDDLISKVQTWFAGMIKLADNEIKFCHPRLRKIMGNGTEFMWGEINQSAHFEIAKLCLEYLSRPGVKQLIDSSFNVSDAEAFETPIFADRGNLCSYALQALPHHLSAAFTSPFVSSPQNDELHQLLMKNVFNDVGESWARGHWALSNPITRSGGVLRSLYPIFAGLGRLDILESRDERDARQGLLEAASKGQAQTVEKLLQQIESSESEMMEVLVSSLSSGDEDLLLFVLGKVISMSETPSGISWPPSLIHRAAWLGLDRFADRILDLGCSPDAADIEWQSIVAASPLSQACRNFHSKVVTTLVKHNADINRKHLYARQAIHHVSGEGYAEIIKILAEGGKVNLEDKDEEGLTALYFASLWGHHHTVEVLLDLGADPNMGHKSDDSEGMWLPIISAADGGFKRCVELLASRGADVNARAPFGSALLYAALKGYFQVCRLLLENGANPNCEDLESPILTQMIRNFVGKENQQEIFDLLLAHHADANAKDSNGIPVLMWAAISNPADMFMRKLFDHGANVDATNSSNDTALHWIVTNQRLDLVELLLERNPDVNIVNSEGATPLYLSLPREDIALRLLQYGADPDISRRDGFTCLMYAAWFNHKETAEHLIAHNATLDVTYEGSEETFKGYTALTLAARYSGSEIVRSLIESGSDVRHVASDGVPIIQYAALSDTLSAFLEFPSRIDVDQPRRYDVTALHLPGVSFDNFKRLINAGSNMEAQDTYCHDTPLSLAAYYGDQDRCKYLLGRGADINKGSPSQGSPLTQAARMAQISIIKILVENGADVNGNCEAFFTSPLGAAVVQGEGCDSDQVKRREEIAEYLLDQGASLCVKSLHKYVINTCCLVGTPSLVRLLLAKGATVFDYDDFGRGPAHYSSLRGIDNFQVMLEAGANVMQPDKMLRTSIHVASQAGRIQVLKAIDPLHPIKDYVNSQDLDGWTPLCWAARGTESWLNEDYAGEEAQEIEVIKYLLENGADRKMTVAVGGQKWSILKIARFHGQSPEVIDLLKNGLEKKDEEEEESEVDMSFEGALAGNICCDACRCKCRGFYYHCQNEDCLDNFDLCFKCYPHKDLLHNAEHRMEKRGQEFADAPEEAKDTSSDTSDSDAESTGDE